MDLNAIEAVATPRTRDELRPWRAGDAWLAGGTWLFSEEQPHLKRLVDLTALDWPAHDVSGDGLILAATCTFEALGRLDLPKAWRAAPLIAQCRDALLGSFKIHRAATVGGNLCAALPAGPMIALGVALDGVCEIWTADDGERRMPAADFVVGPQMTALAPGEMLRSVALPASALRRRAAFRRISLTPLGRSAALAIATRDDAGAFALTVTAATRRPVHLVFDVPPDAAALGARIAAAIPDALWHDDVHGAPAWRRAMTFHLAEEARAELAGDGRP